MAEVDGILIQSLRHLGCEIGEDVQNIRQFDTDMLVESVTRCLRSINPESSHHLPSRLSASMTAKYKQASVIADACKAVGFPGDLGYEAFLYGGESEMRKLLAFLLDHLPKEESSQVSLAALPYGSILTREIRGGIERELNRAWIPPAFWHFKFSSHNFPFPTCTFPFRSRILSVPVSNLECQMPILSEQCSSATTLAASILELNSLQLATSARKGILEETKDQKEMRTAARKVFLDETKRQMDILNSSASSRSKMNKPPISSKPALPPRKSKKAEPEVLESQVEVSEELPTELSNEEKLSALQMDLSRTSQHVESLRQEVEVIAAVVDKTETAIKEGREFLSSFEKTIASKQQISQALTGECLSNSGLQEELERLKESRADLEQQWDIAKEKLLGKVSVARQQAYSLNSVERLQEEIRECKQAVSNFHTELNEREEYTEVLRKEYNRLTNSSLSRASYTKRIVEILANIKRQRVDIDKIIKDTRIIQKEINVLSGRLDRAFVETDELMFRDGRNDEFVRKAYKYIASFHETCATLISTVEMTGLFMRESRGLEDEVDSETKRDKASNVERILADLELVKAENASLLAKRTNLVS